MILINIQNTYTFTLEPNGQDSAIATFTSPECHGPFTVVLKNYSKFGLNPFFDVMMKDYEIIMTSMFYLKDLWNKIYPNHCFEDRIEEDYSVFGHLPPKIFRINLQPLSFR
jgi:hypothetical protein